MAEEHTTTSGTKEEGASLHFIEQIIADDLQSGKHQRIHTRFPPEPNGYLHIGHAKAICLSFGLAEKYDGLVNLRFDDTNPEKENQEYVDAIRRDVSWLGYEWNGGEFYTSDYFEQLYGFAVKLIELGKAYVDHQTAEEMAAQKGTPTSPGTNSPHRDRPVEENLRLFKEMRDGVHPDGHCVLRANIDMAHTTLHMRDPLLYRIKRAHHHRTGDDWCIYPMYDFAHGQSDSIENITHSLCTLEFEVHRPLYEWFIEQLGIFPSRQIEFARLNLDHTVMTKRKLLRLVEAGHVDGWDDPRCRPSAVCAAVGSHRSPSAPSATASALLRERHRLQLARMGPPRPPQPRRTAGHGGARPIKLVITNYPERQTEDLPSDNNLKTRVLVPATCRSAVNCGWNATTSRGSNRKWFRLAPGKRFGSSPPTSSNTSTTWSARTAGWRRCTSSTSQTARAVPTPVASKPRARCTGSMPPRRSTLKSACMTGCIPTPPPMAMKTGTSRNS